MDKAFKVNLRGIIDLLSEHLYSSPDVFVRELLQNAVDAIAARRKLDAKHEGAITIELIKGSKDSPPSIVVDDNGVGLTEDDAHQFLATIGESSKRGIESQRRDFIGQFGIGLLSAFVVSDEIVVVTRSAKPGAQAIEWKGRSDGGYTVRPLKADITPGTRVHLRAKEGREEYFEPQRVVELAKRYGSMLAYPITVTAAGKTHAINEASPPWLFETVKPTGKARSEMVRYGKRVLQGDFFDVIPLASDAGGVHGAAFVLAKDAGPHARHQHRVYLKRMFLTDRGDGLLPEWAFFVRCIVNATDLRPTASREGFYDDAALEKTRESLGKCIRDYLLSLAEEDPDRLERLIAIHHQAIKHLASHDDELFEIFIDLLPFETTMGTMSMGEFRKENKVVRYVPTRDQFRQIAPIASAQSIPLINAGYAYDRDLLEKLPSLFPDTQVEAVDVTAVAQALEDLTLDERDATGDFVAMATVALRGFGCAVELRRFKPADLPALYTTAADAEFLRSAGQAQEMGDELWSGLVGKVAGQRRPTGPLAQVCFNLDNPLVARLTRVKNRDTVERTVQLLYVQALLLGHHPLTSAELQLLSGGLLGLIESTLD